MKGAKSKIANPILVQSDKFNSKYFPDDSPLKFEGMKVMKPKDPEVVTAQAQGKSYNGVTVTEEIRLQEATQPPHTDSDHQLFEASVRRNWAVKSALSVREHFTFGYGSELVIELAESEKVGLNDEQVEKKVEELTKIHADIIKSAYDRDERLHFEKHLKVFWWQSVLHGRGLIIKYFDNNKQDLAKSNNEVKSLKPVNSRRLGMPIFDVNNDMSFEGVIVDGQGLSKNSMIYGTYQDVQLSPHTEGYGYSQIESIVHIAEELNMAVEEDFKEILKSAWLASILFVINTAGLTEQKAKNKLQTIIDSISPAKYIGINEDIQDFKQLDLDPDYNGLVQLVDNLETKIYKALHVPQFLVQSESIANRATALQSASLFINGIITDDQTWLSDTLSEQWYDPFVERELKKKKTKKDMIKRNNKTFSFDDKTQPLQKGDKIQRDDGKTEDGETKFKIRRIFNQAKVADFIDLADALSKLFAVGIWDAQKVNEELGSEEVTPRVIAEQKEKEAQFQQNNTMPFQKSFKNGQEVNPKEAMKENIKNEANNLQTAIANANPEDLKKYKAGVFKFLFEKVNELNTQHNH